MLGSNITRIEVHAKAVGRILKSAEVRDWALRKGEASAGAAGPGFRARVFYGFDRVSVVVAAETSEAQRAFANDSTVLTSAIDAARD